MNTKSPTLFIKKRLGEKTTVHAHDEENISNVGDKVKITSTRPMSKLNVGE